MSKFQGLKDFINLRLNAAVEEIFGHVERAIAEYEEEIYRRHRKMFDTGLAPLVELQSAGVQQLVMVGEDFPPEHQDWRSSLDQGDPELLQIKEEQEEGEQLEWLEEAGITTVPVKSEEDEESAHRRRTPAGEDSGGPGPDDKTGDSAEPDTEDSDEDWRGGRKSQAHGKSVQTYRVPISGDRCVTCVTDQNLSICAECGKRFSNKTNLKVHMLIHTREKPFSCTSCGRRFSEKHTLIRHMEHHKDKKPFSCSVCQRRFRYRGAVWIHKKTHREKESQH